MKTPVNTICASIIIILLLLSCSGNKEKPYPELEYGLAKVSGKIHGDSIPDFIVINTTNPITTEHLTYTPKIEKGGVFSIEIPVVGNALAGITCDDYTGLFAISPGKKSLVNLYYDKKEGMRITIEGDSWTNEDLTSEAETAVNIIEDNNLLPHHNTLDASVYSRYVIERIDSIVNIVRSDITISTEVKKITVNQLKLFYLDKYLLDYPQAIGDSINNSINPNRSYYSFLQYFDLNNPDYIVCSSYPFVLQNILKKLSVPPLADQDTHQWIDEVKSEIGELVGIDNGFFYDMLVSSSYASQLSKMQPFSDKQVQNIYSFFQQHPAYHRALLAENDKIKSLLNDTVKNSRINQTPDVPKEEVMASIISRYQGKVVFVDFWATWCGSCLKTIREMKSVKERFENQDVVFLYITTTSSPLSNWHKMVNEISGQHYYLSEMEWDYLMDTFGFDGIPAYLLFDKDGVLRENAGGDMDSEKIEKILEAFI